MPDSFFVSNQAYYSQAEVAVYIPDAIVSLAGSLPAVTIGRVGWIMAHELVHALDPSGIHFDHTGLYVGKSVMLLSDEEWSSYDRFISCISTGRANHMAEDFADILGALAVKECPGYQSGIEIGPPSFTLTSEQTLAVSMSQLWCTSSAELDTPVSDPHSFSESRVTKSMAPFLSAFECEVAPYCHIA